MNNLNSILDYLKVFNNINKRPAYKPRTMYNQGQLVRNTADGSRPGYGGLGGDKISKSELNQASKYFYKVNYDDLKTDSKLTKEKKRSKIYSKINDYGKRTGDYKFVVKTQETPLSKTDQAKILKQYPEAKFGPKRKYGFAPTDPEYQSVFKYVKDNFKTPYEGGMFKSLPKYSQKELIEAFPEVDFNFDRNIEFSTKGSQFSKYGVPVAHPKYAKISKYFAKSKAWKYNFDLRSPEGWMMSQMERNYAQNGDASPYRPITKNGKPIAKGNPMIGIEHNGKKYNMKTIVDHADFANTKKYWNIADKTSKKYLSEFDNLAKLLPEGFDPKKIQVNDLLQFISDKDGIKGLNKAKRAIQIHHEYGVGPRATTNYQLLRQDMNLLANKTNNLLKSKDLSKVEKGAAKALKDETRLVVDDVRYGPQKVSATGDIKKIISQAEGELKKFTKKDFKTFKDQLVKLGCGMYAGGRVGFQVGSGKCITRATAKLKSGNLSSAEKKLVDAMGDGLKKGGMPKKFWTTALKGEGYFALADFANNLTKGQSLDKSFSNAIEMATFGALDLGGNERDLMKYAEERGLDTKDMKEWMDYAQTYGKYVSTSEDLEEAKEAAAGGDTMFVGPDDDMLVQSRIDELPGKIKKIKGQLEEKGKSETLQSGKGYKDLNEMIEGVVAKEWNKPAGTVLDRGLRKMLGMKGDEGLVWGPIGSAFREGIETLGFGEHKSLKGFTPQTVMNYHPAYGYKEDIKDVIRGGDSPMEDMLMFMEKNYPSYGLVNEALRTKEEDLKEKEQWVDTGFGRKKKIVNKDMGTYDYNPDLAEGGIASLNVKK